MTFRLSLIVKLTLATSLILIVFMCLLNYVNIKNFRKVMIEYSVTDADKVAEIINQSAYDAMMKNDKASLYQMIHRIAQSSSIEHIRLIDREGKVVQSNNTEEIGKIFAISSEACAMCHRHGNPKLQASSMNRSRIYLTATGKEVMGLTKAIYNQPACTTGLCHFHRKEHNILGVLDVGISLENMQQKSIQYRMEFLIMTCLLVVLIGLMITFMTLRFVDKPVQHLLKHTALIAEGNLDIKVPVTSYDELGDLSNAVNHMTVELKKAHEELTEWGISLEHKVEERTHEIKRMEAQLYRSEKLASLGKLVAGIAHEINNPLTGVLLYASIIQNDNRINPVFRTDLDRIISETKRCAEIVKRLLEFSRETAAHKASFFMDELLDKSFSLISKQPCFHDISICKNYTPSLPCVIADPDQIEQVFINLFMNACHAMPGGGTLTLSTTIAPDNSYVCAEVKDTGCGISKENLNKIFDPFFTTKDDGTGLGLSISYGIVENNNGQIEVKSMDGEGTIFTVKLPVDDGTVTEALVG
jgi:two-component system NtrC family sensor kinase